MESLSTYYDYWVDENETDHDKLVWERFTEEEWCNMTCAERSEAIHEQLASFTI